MYERLFIIYCLFWNLSFTERFSELYPFQKKNRVRFYFVDSFDNSSLVHWSVNLLLTYSIRIHKTQLAMVWNILQIDTIQELSITSSECRSNQILLLLKVGLFYYIYDGVNKNK